ncbi:hypothetical protein LQU94_02620 [Peptoniphilus sp. KCTC 25270]|uniref:LysM peptidoglycan-binding domain-containing protein n=1 Tax=Peptoniphilus sp. KCTC 25270 TaxID=2897414 RepID=UPI001E601922|nr:LysM peptidoglycan-binding domain-containing protein [Peptoniphilus sp. KCTC 25270]MCD1147008.1 hypothetical protein [Peptoniphilus sp. KCTC 25270]
MKKKIVIHSKSKVIFLLILSMFLSMGITVKNDSPKIVYYEREIYTIHSGDNIWNLAEKIRNEDEDIRVVIDRIKEDNQLESALLQTGSKIVLNKKIER